MKHQHGQDQQMKRWHRRGTGQNGTHAPCIRRTGAAGLVAQLLRCLALHLARIIRAISRLHTRRQCRQAGGPDSSQHGNRSMHGRGSSDGRGSNRSASCGSRGALPILSSAAAAPISSSTDALPSRPDQRGSGITAAHLGQAAAASQHRLHAAGQEAEQQCSGRPLCSERHLAGEVGQGKRVGAWQLSPPLGSRGCCWMLCACC